METDVINQESALKVEPREALTGFLELPSVGRIRLDVAVLVKLARFQGTTTLAFIDRLIEQFGTGIRKPVTG